LYQLFARGYTEYKYNSEYLGEIKVGAKANEKCYDLSGKFKSMQDLMISDWRNIKLAEFPNLDENSG